MSKFDDKMMRQFEQYLKLQKSGEINMVSAQVRERLGITKEEHVYIMEHYSELLKEYNDLKVVDEVIADAKNRAEGNDGKGKGLDDKEVRNEHDFEALN